MDINSYTVKQLVEYAAQGVDLLYEYHDCFDYAKMGDKSYKELPQAQYVTSVIMGAVRAVMPKASVRHTRLTKVVAGDIGGRPGYEWLVKVTARIISEGDTFNNAMIDKLREDAESVRRVKNPLHPT